MSIIGKQLPEFTLDAFKKPELVKVRYCRCAGQMVHLRILSSRLHICLPYRIRRRTKLLCRIERTRLRSLLRIL